MVSVIKVDWGGRVACTACQPISQLPPAPGFYSEWPSSSKFVVLKFRESSSRAWACTALRLFPSTMSSAETGTAATEPAATVRLSTVFCADDADVVIRAAGTLDFRVHKCILSLVSPIFKDMFTIPQPPTDTPGVLPHVDVEDSPNAWENILRTIYPMPHPPVNNLDDLESLLLTAKKYEMEFVINLHQQSFRNRNFIQEDPLRLYAIACAGGFEDQAKYVARHAEHLKVVGRSDVGDLRGLTLESYHRLISFLVKRDKEWYQTLAGARTPHKSCCQCSPGMVYEKIKRELNTPYFPSDEIYIKALEYSSKNCDLYKEGVCALEASEMKDFIKLMVKGRDTVCDKLIW